MTDIFTQLHVPLDRPSHQANRYRRRRRSRSIASASRIDAARHVDFNLFIRICAAADAVVRATSRVNVLSRAKVHSRTCLGFFFFHLELE